MKFIQFEEHRINPEAIDYYHIDYDELFIYFRGGTSLDFQGSRAADLVKLLDKAIGVAGEEA
ncbi:hypothetical protein H6F67_03385 [Microcoleus sp. FACHB-1515]|uniref:hypothetical protein n=1 Tax=Cyanophyceae TaxID=3028117 RepID=UPI001683AC66|nr:hypothetical protein [Microcoleus sp. FACHB-1515]MBD2088893.1 hypothetical protein [Microcoleus sp. FACHB-1515]